MVCSMRKLAGASLMTLSFWSGDDTPSSAGINLRSEEHTSELQSLMRISYAVFCLKKKKKKKSEKKYIQKTTYKHSQRTYIHSHDTNNIHTKRKSRNKK